MTPTLLRERPFSHPILSCILIAGMSTQQATVPRGVTSRIGATHRRLEPLLEARYTSRELPLSQMSDILRVEGQLGIPRQSLVEVTVTKHCNQIAA